MLISLAVGALVRCYNFSQSSRRFGMNTRIPSQSDRGLSQLRCFSTFSNLSRKVLGTFAGNARTFFKRLANSFAAFIKKSFGWVCRQCTKFQKSSFGGCCASIVASTLMNSNAGARATNCSWRYPEPLLIDCGQDLTRGLYPTAAAFQDELSSEQWKSQEATILCFVP